MSLWDFIPVFAIGTILPMGQSHFESELCLHNLVESHKLLVKREDRGPKPEGSEYASSRLTLSSGAPPERGLCGERDGA